MSKDQYTPADKTSDANPTVSFFVDTGSRPPQSIEAKFTAKAQKIAPAHYLEFTFATINPVESLTKLLAIIEMSEEVIYWQFDEEQTQQLMAYGECSRGACRLVQGTSSLTMKCIANNVELLKSWHSKIQDALGVTLDRREDVCNIVVWSAGNNYPEDRRVKLHAPTWDEISNNYTPDVRQALNQLFENIKKSDTGGIHIWHGVPGTGKTTALRCIARELAKTAKMHLITDPQEFLSGKTNYVITVLEEGALMNNQGSQLIVLEDAGELLSKDARTQVGQGLSRVLNLTDGMLGQNAKANIIITTNEEIGVLHPALLRPGRCASEIDFRAFNVAEANQWLKDKGSTEVVNETKTLADLYAISTGIAPIRVHENKVKIGFN